MLNRTIWFPFFMGWFLLIFPPQAIPKTSTKPSPKRGKTNGIKPDPKIEAFLKPYRKKLLKKMAKIIVTTQKSFTRRRPESTLGNLVAEKVMQYLKAHYPKTDIFISNVTGLRSDIPPGNITLGTLFEVMPFENQIVIIKLTGRQLKRVFQGFAKKGGEPISGATCYLDKKRKQAHNILINGKPIQNKKLYHLATLDYLAETGWMKKRLHRPKLKKTGVLIRDAVLWSLKNKGLGTHPYLDKRVQYKSLPRKNSATKPASPSTQPHKKDKK